jgi:hypothetical protein
VTFSLMRRLLSLPDAEDDPAMPQLDQPWHQTVLTALQESTQLVVSEDRGSVRRSEALPNDEDWAAARAAIDDETAALVGLSGPVVDIAWDELRPRKAAAALLSRARELLEEGMQCYLSGQHWDALRCLRFVLQKLLSSHTSEESDRPLGLGHESFRGALSRADAHKRFRLLDAMRLNMASAELAIARSLEEPDPTQQRLQYARGQLKRSGLLETHPEPGSGRRLIAFDDPEIERAGPRATAHLLAAQIDVEEDRVDAADV